MMDFGHVVLINGGPCAWDVELVGVSAAHRRSGVTHARPESTEKR
jgi:hypothetical protein